MGEKVGFTNSVFEKLCFFSENTIFIVFSANTAFQKQNCMLKKNRKFMKNSGLFLSMAKWCFWVCFFEVLMLLWFVFGVWHSSRSVKNACFSQFFWLLWGGLFLFILGVEGLGVFVFLVFVFVFVLLLFLFCLLCFVLLLDCFWCWFLFCFCFCFFMFFLLFFVLVFFVSCSCFFCFCFFLFFFLLFCFFCFLRVRWGGPKALGHLTWP